MANHIQNFPEHNSIQPSLLIVAHCSTIQRKTKRIDIKELSAILDDFTRELNILNSKTYLYSLNEILKTLNSNFPRALFDISSHYFFSLLRNTIRNLLQRFYTNNQLNDQEMYALRNTTVLINHFVEKIKDVSKILHWITDATFLDSLGKSLKHINKLSRNDENKHIIKQVTRLLNMFCDIQKRLPIDLHQTLFVRLLQPVIDCLTSINYVKLFKSLKPNVDSMTEKQKLFLIKCPSFLTSYNGPHMDKELEQVLEIMLPRYVTILSKHIKTIKEWNRPMMHAIHNLIRTIIFAQGYFSSYTNNKSFRSLIDQLFYLLNETILINKIQPNSKNVETLLIQTTLSAFNVLVDEANALDYIKQCKSTILFYQLTRVSNEDIILSAYSMLIYIIDENDLELLQTDLLQLLFTNLNLLQKALESRYEIESNRENIERNIILFIETFQRLIKYEQIEKEIIQQGLVKFLIDCYEKLNGISKQLILECLWTLSFNQQITQQLRQYEQFIFSLQNTEQNALSHISNISEETKKIVDGLLWNLVKEPIFREKISNRQKYKYDIMISYCDADRDIVYKIEQFLTHQGYNVWLDREQNYGHEFVAEVIQNSEFVIICMSDLYKQNNRCRAEAEYAFNCKQQFLFLLNLRNNFKPDGWLTSIIGNNTYIDFGRSDFKTAYTLLTKKIKHRQRKKEILYDKPIISIPVYIPYEVSNNDNTPQVQETPSYIVPRSPTPESAGYTESDAVDTQQQHPSMESISRSPSPSLTTPTSFVINEQQEQEQEHQPIIAYPVLRSSIPGYTSSYSFAAVENQQQTPIQPMLRSLSPNPSTPVTSTIIDKQQDQAPIMDSSSFGIAPVADSQQPEESAYTIAQPLISTLTSSTMSIDFDKPQHLQIDRPLQLESSNTILSDQSIDVTKQRQQQQSIEISSGSRLSSTTNTVLPDAPTAAVRQQPQISTPLPPRSFNNDLAPFPASIIINNNQSQEKQVNPVLPSTTAFNNVRPSTCVVLNRQQQQQTPINLNPNLLMPVAVSSVNSTLPTTSETYVQEPPQLPEEYTNRKTNNSIYRTLSINAWNNNDILDFLCDLNLHLMMPLCESMSGKAFAQLFRMCQAKPSRLYGLLNEELRVRFKGLTLPMGIYTQFLVEMDGLVGPTLDTIPLIPASTPKHVEQIPSVPLKPIPTQSDSRFPILPRISPIQWTDITPIQTKSKPTSPHPIRVIERAVLSTKSRRQTIV